MWYPLSPYISCNSPHFFYDILMHQGSAKNSFGWYIYLRMAGTSEIIPNGFRKYYIKKICHNMKKKKCQHILFTPPQHRSKRPVRLYQMQIHSHIKHSFLKCFSEYKCVFRIKMIQLHEKKSWLLSLVCTQKKWQFSCYSWNKSEEATLLGEQKTSIFPKVYPKPIDNTGEWSMEVKV